MHLDVHAQKGGYFISPPAGASQALPGEIFDAQWLSAKGLIEGSAAGRSQAWFINLGDRHLVLRHYRRGGLPARLSDDRFAWTGLTRTRPWRELAVLLKLRSLGLPVPVPVAGHVSRDALCYRAAILTERIDGARPLAVLLSEANFGANFGDRHQSGGHETQRSEQLWRELGRVIRAFHEAGAHHADLNVRNILVDRNDRVWLIDWDRGRLGAKGRIHANSLRRLRRSLSRERHLDEAARRGWGALMKAYEGRC